ncbi:hypothetical protein GQX73_g3400 [Xylaria multiplex]|uniref:Uncharacterized protein n=1 Tax=Xylaria multiplex TaxID=323545 RepID=A0A7C8IUE8_9PEZI|nr:hypothetical protein GQX73_g3400 [Xylaria multiplex]
MAGKRTEVPDAWDDDDWQVKADQAAAADPGPEADESQTPMTKAQRLAQHAESNKRLWQSAETPAEPFHFLAARSEPPLATEFKPAVKVLSRKPAPKMITKRDPLTGALSQLRVEDEEDDDDGKNKIQLTPDEIRAKHQREREEKQRRYEEVRAKIFGTTPAASGSGNGSNPSSGTSTPGNSTPPRSSTDGRGLRGRGRGRGGGSGHRYNDSRGDNSNSQRPGSQSGPNGRELFDPSYSPKPGFSSERRGGGTPVSGRPVLREEDQVIRSPRGPDGNSRGFAKRGAKAS